MDTAYGRRWIRRIGNCEYAFSCEDLALIRRISFPGYGVLSIPSEDPYEEVARQLLEQAPTPPLPPSFLSPRTPPLLPIPLPAPSTSRRANIPEADTPPRKRLLLTTPRPGCKVGESFAAAAARQPGPTMARRVDCSSINTMETRVRDTERRMIAALEKIRAAVRAEIGVLRRERDLLTMLETEARRHEWQRQDADDHAVEHIMHTQALEVRARMDTLEDTGSSS
ncbi:hypothetical protein Tco_0369664 [Tanacetum coccineum]